MNLLLAVLSIGQLPIFKLLGDRIFSFQPAEVTQCTNRLDAWDLTVLSTQTRGMTVGLQKL